MTAYAVTGTLSPDVTTANTGEPDGYFGDPPYWQWLVGETLWILSYTQTIEGPKPTTTYDNWFIDTLFGGGSPWYWLKKTVADGSPDPVGEYAPMNSATGTATVAEYVPPSNPTYATLTINDGPLAGQYIVLKTG